MNTAALDVGVAINRIKPDRNTILVAGTGLSMALTNQDYPQLSWTGLLCSGFEYAANIGKLTQETAGKWLGHLKSSPTTDEILTIAGFLSNTLSSDDKYDYSKWMREEFSEIEIRNKALAAVIKGLSDSGVKICTLNYDSVLEKVTDRSPVYMTDAQDVSEWFSGENKGILHLHGHWKKAETCILSSQDYHTTIQSSTRSFFQQHLTVFEKALFVGCGGTFEDPNFDKTLSWLRNELKMTKHTMFALVRDAEVSKRKADPAWKNIVEPVSFGSNYADLGPFLQALFRDTLSHSQGEYPDLRGNSAIFRMDQGEQTAGLDAIHYPLPPAPQAMDVRHAQFFQADQILKNHRRLWLAADWGMGEDEFLSALIARASNKTHRIFSVNIDNFTDKNSFFHQLEDLLGASYQAFCNSLSQIDQAYLLLKNVPLDDCPDKQKLIDDLTSVTDLLISYCPNLRVVLTSRNLPEWRGEAVELPALDDADTRTYIESHPLYKGGLGNDDFTQLYEYTSGVPSFIKATLDKLAVASLEEIINERGSSKIKLAGRFGDSLRALANAQEVDSRYAFFLLKSLSAFPYGEYLENIKRVDKSKKYTIDHVVILQKEGFIYVEEQDSFGHSGKRALKKRLLVTRPVKEWLTQQTKPKELARIRSDAYKLYFGNDWETQEPRLHDVFKASDISEKSSEIKNAKKFIVDIFAEGKSNLRLRAVGIDLASQFCVTVSKKSYYKVVQDLYVALKPMLDDREKDERYWYFIYVCAKSLRMAGANSNWDEALEMLLECLKHISEPKLVGSIKLHIAMIYSSRKAHAEAVDYATQAQKLTKGNVAMQANHIALKNSDLANKEAEISKIQAKAKSKATALYSNIALDRADELKKDENKVAILGELVDYCHTNKDLYNEIRATLSYSETVQAVRGALEPKQISILINIYHHLYQDSMASLHSKCHRILWKAFKQRSDFINLLQLFRYSSLYWRRRDEQKPELDAVQEFRKLELPSTIPERDYAMSYYYGRLSTIEN